MTSKLHPSSLPLLELTNEYPAIDEGSGSDSLWRRLKKALAPTGTDTHPAERATWFTVYEEPNRGFVVFEGQEAKRIIIADGTNDTENVVRCRDLFLMLNDVHTLFRQIDDREAAAFHERFVAEVWPILQDEPGGRRPLLFIHDVDSADARLNGMFYQAICLAYAAIERTWHEREPEVEAEMEDHQDRVIRLWKKRAAQPDLTVWKRLLEETLRFLERARCAATTETKPDVACQHKETSAASPPETSQDSDDEDVPSLDQMLIKRDK